MKTFISLIIIFQLFISLLEAQDTFSICAVDSATGEVGSAGASCIDNSQIAGGAFIISDVHPGIGVVHTQSFWDVNNQNYAKGLMNQGLSPQQIIDSLVANDVSGNSSIRQYGIVDLINGGRSAAFTGTNCFDYKNHITGKNYSIQGNILLGQQILDSMEARFKNTNGELACKLMAALQGAKVPGADTRCMTKGTSSLSAFVRVAKPTDTIGNFYLDLNVSSVTAGKEPIDSLQTLFNSWAGCNANNINEIIGEEINISIFPNPFSTSAMLRIINLHEFTNVELKIYDLLGREVKIVNSKQLIPQDENKNKIEIKIDRENLPSGMYFYKIISAKKTTMRKIIIL